MDDATALRLKKIELTVQAAERSAGIDTQLRIAVLVVGLTVATSAIIAGIASTMPAFAAGIGTSAGGVVVLTQVRSILIVRERLSRAHEAAIRSIDSLIGSGGER